MTPAITMLPGFVDAPKPTPGVAAATADRLREDAVRMSRRA